MDMFQVSHAASTVPSESLPKYLGNIDWDTYIPSINSAEEGFTFIEKSTICPSRQDRSIQELGTRQNMDTTKTVL